MTDSRESLLSGNWESQNRKRLARMITEHAHADNYAVFDWDFTCIFFDVQYSFFIHQIEQLYFKLSPEAFACAIRSGIPQDACLKNAHTVYMNGSKAITVQDVWEDLDARYRFLYGAYEGLNGSLPLDKIHETHEYLDFKAKLLMLGGCAEHIASVDIAQSLTAGMSLEELSRFTEASIDTALQLPITHYEITSPIDCAGKTGVITVSYATGIRIQPEMQQLLHLLRQYGITPYVCSASQQELVRVFACNPKYGYNLKPEQVFGRRQKTDASGRVSIERDVAAPRPFGKGKATTIQECMAPQHGGKPPILVAGDSDGDFYMMEAFRDSALLLIFNRYPTAQALIYPLIQAGLAERDNPDSSIIVQHRDHTTGCFTEYQRRS